jgi:hypothetical protein
VKHIKIHSHYDFECMLDLNRGATAGQMLKEYRQAFIYFGKSHNHNKSLVFAITMMATICHYGQPCSTDLIQTPPVRYDVTVCVALVAVLAYNSSTSHCLGVVVVCPRARRSSSISSLVVVVAVLARIDSRIGKKNELETSLL